ncbi:MAG TPA: glycoside hydrolase family 2 TIM barrel-domain containing protein, partial [Thermoleophilaceae bacterium]
MPGWRGILGVAGVLVLLATAGATAEAAAPIPPERVLYTDAPNGMFLLDGDWTTRADPGNLGVREGWWHEGSADGFTSTSIPNAFNAGDLSKRSFKGGVQWYRATFTAPQVDGVAQWRFRFESVNVEATVWLNGTRIGLHRGAYLPFELAVSRSDLRSAENELVVRVDSRGSPNDIQPSNRPLGWWNYGGILREVYLRAVRSFDLADLHVTAAPGEPAKARITATVRNMSVGTLPAPVTLHLTGPGFDQTTTVDAGSVAPLQTKPIAAAIDIPSPRLWAPGHPTLYQLTVDVPGGQRTTTHFGIRRWTVSGGGRLLLNGKAIVLRGASFHEQTEATGAALTPDDRNELVGELRAVGANFAREHYPPHPALLEAFDRAGVVFWEQIPVWRVSAKQLRSGFYRHNAISALRDAVMRDRNHASIAAWSVSNETLRGGSAEVKYLREARALLDRLDPTGLVAADKALRPLSDLPRSYRLLDAIGLNEYVGWYGGRTRELPRDLATVHRRFPRQALVITEFGAEANRAGRAGSKGTYAFQQRFLASHLRIFDRTPYVSGALAWVLRDFAVRPGWT